MRDFYTILDVRGLVLKSLHSGTDPDRKGKVNTPGYGLQTFVEQVFLPLLDINRLGHIIAVWDCGNDYRKMLWPEYKAHRKELEPEVKQARDEACEMTKEFLRAMGVAQCGVEGTEADDVIAYLSQNLPSCVIHTVDNDLVQLAVNACSVMVSGRVKEYLEPEEGLRVEPRFIALYKALVGDPSDGYKGVPNFGIKAYRKLSEECPEALDAMKTVAESGDLNLLRGIQHPLMERIRDNLTEFLRSYQLSTLYPELVDVNWGLAALDLGHNVEPGFRTLKWDKRVPSRQALLAVLKKAGCPALLSRLGHLMPQKNLITMDQIENWDEDLKELEDLFQQSPFVALDWETCDDLQHEPFRGAAKDKNFVDVVSSRIVGAGITLGPDLQYTLYFSFGHKDTNNLPLERLGQIVSAIPQGVPKVAHNSQGFEIPVYRRNLGQDLTNCRDTRILASYVREWDDKGLKHLSLTWLKYRQTSYREVIEEGKTMADYSAAHVFNYGADDPLCTAHLYDLFKIICQLEGSWGHIAHNEFPAQYTLVDGFMDGVSIDVSEVKKQREADEALVEEKLKALYKLLEDHQTEDLIAKGADNLFALAEEVIEAKHRAGLVEDRQAALEKARRKAEEGARFVRPRQVPVEWSPKFTKTTINRVLEHLGSGVWIDKWAKGSVIRLCKQALDEELEPEPVRKFLLKLNDWLSIRRWAGDHSEFLNWLSKEYPELGGYEIIGQGLNLNSSPQLVALLYGKLALPVRLRNLEITKTRQELGLTTGSPLADEDAIRDALANVLKEGDWRRDALNCLLEAKKADTRLKLFYGKWQQFVHPATGQVHPYFNQVGAETRRPTGSNPNMLQLPKKGEGIKLRRIILPNRKRGHDVVVSADWASEELRVGAALSGDKNMLAAFDPENPKNLHAQVGARIIGTDYDSFMQVYKDPDHPRHKEYSDARSKGKSTVFGSQYMIGAAKLSRQLLCPEEEAAEFLIAKREAYPGYESWKEGILKEVQENGYVTTLFGSRKHVFNRWFQRPDLQSYFGRASVNYKIQALCADVLKRLLADMHKSRFLERHDATFVAPIYDEVVLTCHHSKAPGLVLELCELMNKPVPGLGIDLIATPSVGPNFADQTEVLEDEYEELTEDKVWQAMKKAGVLKEEAA